MEKIEVLEKVGKYLLSGELNNAKIMINEQFPCKHLEATGRTYTDKQKMQECHNAYWEFVPTVDHIYPVALGGADSEENWATTSMLHNSIKNNGTLEQLSMAKKI